MTERNISRKKHSLDVEEESESSHADRPFDPSTVQQRDIAVARKSQNREQQSTLVYERGGCSNASKQNYDIITDNQQRRGPIDLSNPYYKKNALEDESKIPKYVGNRDCVQGADNQSSDPSTFQLIGDKATACISQTGNLHTTLDNRRKRKDSYVINQNYVQDEDNKSYDSSRAPAKSNKTFDDAKRPMFEVDQTRPRPIDLIEDDKLKYIENPREFFRRSSSLHQQFSKSSARSKRGGKLIPLKLFSDEDTDTKGSIEEKIPPLIAKQCLSYHNPLQENVGAACTSVSIENELNRDQRVSNIKQKKSKSAEKEKFKNLQYYEDKNTASPEDLHKRQQAKKNSPHSSNCKTFDKQVIIEKVVELSVDLPSSISADEDSVKLTELILGVSLTQLKESESLDSECVQLKQISEKDLSGYKNEEADIKSTNASILNDSEIFSSEDNTSKILISECDDKSVLNIKSSQITKSLSPNSISSPKRQSDFLVRFLQSTTTFRNSTNQSKAKSSSVPSSPENTLNKTLIKKSISLEALEVINNREKASIIKSNTGFTPSPIKLDTPQCKRSFLTKESKLKDSHYSPNKKRIKATSSSNLSLQGHYLSPIASLSSKIPNEVTYSSDEVSLSSRNTDSSQSPIFRKVLINNTPPSSFTQNYKFSLNWGNEQSSHFFTPPTLLSPKENVSKSSSLPSTPSGKAMKLNDRLSTSPYEKRIRSSKLRSPKTISPNSVIQRHSLSPNSVIQRHSLSPNSVIQRRSLSPNSVIQRRSLSPNSVVQRHSLSPFSSTSGRKLNESLSPSNKVPLSPKNINSSLSPSLREIPFRSTPSTSPQQGSSPISPNIHWKKSIIQKETDEESSPSRSTSKPSPTTNVSSPSSPF